MPLSRPRRPSQPSGRRPKAAPTFSLPTKNLRRERVAWIDEADSPISIENSIKVAGEIRSNVPARDLTRECHVTEGVS